MDSEAEKLLRELEEMSFEEKISTSRLSIKDWTVYPYLITYADIGNRREKVYQFIEGLNLRLFDENLYQPGSDDYDMVIIKEVKSPLDLYKIFDNHNFKFILFDTDKIFSSKWYIDILQGAICASPDSGYKWTIEKEGQKPFQFKGTTMFITDKELKDLTASPRFKYILRDTIHWI